VQSIGKEVRKLTIKTIREYPIVIAVVNSDKIIITDGQSALDFMMSVRYNTESDCIALNKEAICEDFFKLSTGLAGEVLQKFVNYNLKFAIIGDFTGYTSQPLKDFIYECNKGGHIFFLANEDEAVKKFAGVMKNS